MTAQAKLAEVLPVPRRPLNENAFDMPRVEAAVYELLAGIGEDPEREGLVDTPKRVAKAFREMVEGLYQDPNRHLDRVLEHEGADGDLVTVRDIEFASMCEHHLLPFQGKAHVAYIPSADKVVGLSKIARTVDAYARRPQIQERLGAQIADAIQDRLNAKATLVVLESKHTCMTIRGAHKPGADMLTTAVRGAFVRDRAARSEALSLLRSGNG
jgi:GTP cyclohydrolase I